MCVCLPVPVCTMNDFMRTLVLHTGPPPPSLNHAHPLHTDPTPPDAQVRYTAKDSEEMEAAVGGLSGEMRELYLDMQRARRQRCLGRLAVDDMMDVPRCMVQVGQVRGNNISNK